MKSNIRDLIITWLIIIFVSTLISAGLIGLISIFGAPKIIIYFIWTSITLALSFLLIVRPGKVLLAGHLRFRTPPEVQHYLDRHLAKYEDKTMRKKLEVHVIEDGGYCAMYFADLTSTHLVFSSKLIAEWNEIDIESVLLYLFELQKQTLPLRDTAILVLATIAERFIITSFMGAALIHLVRSHTQDSVIDVRVVGKMKYAMGYTNMLAKFRQSTEVSSRVPASFGMNALADIAKKSAHQSLYAVHETIDARIEAIRMDPSTNSPTQASGYLSP